MDLLPMRQLLESQLTRFERQFEQTVIGIPVERLARRYQLEGILSHLWQAWCSFSRNICISSATGCTTAGGIVCAASISPTTWERASYIAIRGAKGDRVKPGNINSLLRHEPTWGDASKIVDILNALNPQNKNTLKASLAGGLPGPMHCQIVRNACAHTNHQTKADVLALAVSYIPSPIVHPVDALTWRIPVTGDFAFLDWIDDMRTIADGAIA